MLASTTAPTSPARSRTRRRQHRGSRRPHTVLLAGLLVTLALLVGLAGCADAPSGADSAVGPAAPAGGGPESADEAAVGGAAQRDRAGADGAADDAGAREEASGNGDGEQGSGAEQDMADSYGRQPQGAMVARDAQLDLGVDQLGPAAARVRAAAVAVDGYVLSEELYPEADGEGGHATLVLSVPAQRLDRALEQVAEIGEERGRSMWSEDVTADYVDSSARLETLQASVERTRALMDQAESIEDVVALERELARREADLDALTAHVAALEDDVARSTLTVHLAAGGDATLTEPAPAGFLAGLDQGWTAFTAFVTGALTVLGVTLPFLVLALLVLVPAAVVLRRRRARA